MQFFFRIISKDSWSVLHTHYCVSDKIEKNEMGRACSSEGGGERRVQGFGGKRPLGRPRCRLEDNIKMDLQEVGLGTYGLDWAGSG
jgi:hypothetical protein